MKIVQTANFVAPASGGIRTTLRHLAAGYAAAGHEVVQIVPGEQDGVEELGGTRVLRVRAPRLPGTGYRVISQPWRVAALLDAEQPDRLEVHDRATLAPLGRWARRRRVPSLVVSHERLDRLLGTWTPVRLRGMLPVTAAADRANTALAASFDTVVTTTAWAAAEFVRLGTPNLCHIPLGVELGGFHPDRRDRTLRRAFARDREALLVVASRLSPEKRVDLAVDAVAELVRRRVPVRLVIAGDGAARGRLERRAAGLPVTFLGFVADRERLAGLLASADVALAPGPVETFGLSALEALASGTPVVVHHASALAELVVPGVGLIAAGSGFTFADAAAELLAASPAQVAARRGATRARAEGFTWAATVAGFLACHGGEPAATAAPPEPPAGIPAPPLAA
ncbi:GDP-mannose-dependent alpha-(1-6)-phosphatidylinositol dimannoside mannosyltransferase [Frankia canadensis]|uniref:GDP-mannose-dependent alpha-(1-6)-phosphatidylinositol dimannoside mannosyltransferase n=1 Tax=Frankia canadensis TaxID=1836972 RepID=A0A2I2KPG2_9ACTN|nr:glycosyltransferase [Frankia canadensis]SNQ47554.1 GDP-mannose-dependent alpha-(1-6)-phosphatidylinositol dimannoside mannosyltransferase [Frankia canadensis]SOU54844.1 GDP-mannose-dependent alpha-(1-6)-phosphatidylinositol dimannoside mannosyltransferase [Frankia canadensis]